LKEFQRDQFHLVAETGIMFFMTNKNMD